MALFSSTMPNGVRLPGINVSISYKLFNYIVYPFLILLVLSMTG